MFGRKRRLIEEQCARGKKILEQNPLPELNARTFIEGLLRRPNRIQTLKDALASQEAQSERFARLGYTYEFMPVQYP